MGERMLTEKGTAQCERFKAAYGADLISGVGSVLISPVERTRQTASLIAPEKAQTPLDDLYFVRPWRTEAMREADKALGYAPAREYLEKFPGVYDDGIQKMVEAVESTASSLAPGDVMIVTHAVFISLLGARLLESLAPTEEAERQSWMTAANKVVLDVNVGEVCGFELSEAGARYLENPEPTDFAAAPNNDAFTEPA